MKYQDIKHLLKKGMTVNVITADGCDNDPICLGEQTLVRYVSISGEWATDRDHYIRGQSEIEIVSNPDGSKWVHPSYVELYYQDYLIKERLKAGFTLLNYINEPKAQKGVFMNVIDKIKNFKLTKEDRILRQNGLEDEDGKMTEEAQNIMDEEILQERWLTRRLEIAKDLLEIKNEELKK